ncbi:MAG TPA: PIN domain-containing protein [Chthoniobacter sp.]|jgi:uncharacterized protein YacL
MTPQFTINLLRTLFVTFAACVGSMIGGELLASPLAGVLIGTAFGLAVVLGDRLLHGISLRVFSSATLGLLVGFLFSRLLLSSKVLELAPVQTQWVCGLIVYATFSYVGMMLAIRSNRDEFSLIIPYVRFRQATVQDAPLVIDSNIIIDGRLPALCSTGFLSSSLVVPRFVLAELQRLADSSDPQKRERGRLAFERLQRMQIDPNLSVTIHEIEEDPHTPVDTRLTQIAKLLDARLLTNDTGLCAVARLQNVSVLNLNDLAQALRPHLSAGDHLDLSLTKEGRDSHQAVGYLSDGTMIVVNHARAHIGKTMPVVVASALQTSAGRLFFADLRAC